MNAPTLTHSPMIPHYTSWPKKAGGLLMRVSKSVLKRQALAAAILSAMAVAAMSAAVDRAGAADLTVYPDERQVLVQACPPPQETVILYDEEGVPTVPGRTPYYYCVTGTTLLPGEIPPPPEYCCS